MRGCPKRVATCGPTIGYREAMKNADGSVRLTSTGRGDGPGRSRTANCATSVGVASSIVTSSGWICRIWGCSPTWTGSSLYTLASSIRIVGAPAVQDGTGVAARSSGTMKATWATTMTRAATARTGRRPSRATAAMIQAGR